MLDKLGKKFMLAGGMGAPIMLALISTSFFGVVRGNADLFLTLAFLLISTSWFVLFFVGLGLMWYAKRHKGASGLNTRRDIAFGLLLGGVLSLPGYIVSLMVIGTVFQGVLKSSWFMTAIMRDSPMNGIKVLILIYVYLGLCSLTAFITLPIIGLVLSLVKPKNHQA